MRISVYCDFANFAAHFDNKKNMTKWWRKYWMEKAHIAKGICNDLLGIDSFYIFKNERIFAMKRENYFAFNNYNHNCEPRIRVMINSDEFCFYMRESQRELEGKLFDGGFHVSFVEFFNNSTIGCPTITKDAFYIIPLEKQKCNGCTFFLCPGHECNRRMRKLYYSHGYFLCRKCLNLVYQSQKVSPFERAIRHKLKRSLDEYTYSLLSRERRS